MTVDLFKNNYPDVVLTFNFSNLFPSSYTKLNYTTGEAHDLNGFYVKPLRSGSLVLPIFTGAWRWATLYRRMMNHPWELIAPAGKWWQDPSLRDDPLEVPRMAAVILGSGGKLCLGASARLEGDIYPDQVKQLRILGEWYKPRKKLFTDAVPLKYRGCEVPGVNISPRGVRSMACTHRGEILLHLVNMEGVAGPLKVELRGWIWDRIAFARLEPEGKPLEMERDGAIRRLTLGAGDIDPVDTIIRLFQETSH